MRIIDLLQGSPEWLTWRAGGITATDLPVILGLSPYKTPYRLWLEKTGRANPPDLSGNPHVRRGHELEGIARDVAAEHLGEILIPACAECSDWPVLRASFDALTAGDQPVEIKAPSTHVFQDVLEHGRESATFKLYEAQVWAQCAVSGSREGVLMFYREDAEPLYFDIELDSQTRDLIFQAAEDFWASIQKDKAPAMDPSRDLFIPETGEREFTFRGLAQEWRDRAYMIKSAENQIKSLKAEQQTIQKALVEQMGESLLCDYAGVKITRFMKQGTIDYNKAMTVLEIDSEALEEFRRPPREEVKFTVSKSEVVNEEVVGNELQAPSGLNTFV